MAEREDRTQTASDRTEDGGGPAPAAVAAFGRYQLREQIGAGGMGVVYRARDPALDRELAIKVIRTLRHGHARVLREAQAMARLRGPGVVPVFDVGEVGDEIFVVMPYLAGGTLGAWLRATPRPWREVLDRFVAAGRGLAAAHAAGLVHRDFKPDNVLLDDRGEVAVADFGLAVDANSAPAAIAGTPPYMAPEQLRGEPVDARADVFGFCASLYVGLFGERPFDGDDRAALLDAIVAGRVRPAARDRRAPAWLRAAVVRGLAADPAARWPSMDALLAHLEARRRRPRRVALAAAALAAIAGAAATIAIARGGAPPAPPPTTTFTERPITQRGDVEAASLAQDDRHLAMITAGGELIVADVDGGEERVLATDAWASALAWSSDARRLVYMQRADGTYRLRVVDVATGAATTLPEYGGTAAFAGPDLLVTWGADRKQLALRDLAHPDAPPRTCAVPGSYRWLVDVEPLADGTMFVGVVADDARATGHTMRTDLACARWDVVDGGAQLFDTVVTPRGLVAQDAPDRLVLIDRDGVVTPLATKQPDRPSRLVGVRADGRVLYLETDARWRLLRVAPGRAPTEVTAGALEAGIAFTPEHDRFALYTFGGPLRIVSLAAPAARPAPIERRVFAAAWLPGRRLATLVGDGDRLRLVVEDEHGHHERERPLERAWQRSGLIWLGGDTVAMQRADARTYLAMDVTTGETRTLFDPSLGFTNGLARSPVDGALALSWNRRPGLAIYLVRPGHEPEKLPTSIEVTPVWSARGDALYLLHQQPPRIERLDLATGVTTPYASDLGAPRSQLVGAEALDHDELLVHLAEATSDVYAVSPVR